MYILKLLKGAIKIERLKKKISRLLSGNEVSAMALHCKLGWLLTDAIVIKVDF